MPTIDLSSYKQTPGVASDANKLDNAYDALQATINGLDTNNLTAAAGIKGSQLATGITGPPGAELAYTEFTSNVTSTATTAAGAVAVVTASAVTFDGTTSIWVEFFCPSSVAATGAITAGRLEVYDGATDLALLCEIQNDVASNNQEAPISVKRKLTPSAAAHTYSIRGWASIAGGYTWRAGLGNAGGTLVPGFIRITKV